MWISYQAKANSARESQVMCIALHFSVGEKEHHRDQSAYDHRAAAAPEVLGFAHEACQDGAGDRAEVADGVVAPDFAVAEAAELCAAGADVDGEEDVVEWVGEADEELWWWSVRTVVWWMVLALRDLPS